MMEQTPKTLAVGDRVRVSVKHGRCLPAGLQGSHGTVLAFQPPGTTDCFVRVALDGQEQDWQKDWQLVAVQDVEQVP